MSFKAKCFDARNRSRQQARSCWRSFRNITAATFVRLCYLCYAVVAFAFKVAIKKSDLGWTDFILIGGIPLIVAEGFYVNVRRGGREGKWFTPSACIFLIAIVPTIYDLQLTINDQKRRRTMAKVSVRCLNTSNVTTNSTSQVVAVEDNSLGLLLVQGAVILLVLGKWIIPRGRLSRNEHSQLINALLCAGADIVDFVGLESDVKDGYMKDLVMIVACWSAIQFSIVTTAVKELPNIQMVTVGCQTNEVTSHGERKRRSSTKYQDQRDDKILGEKANDTEEKISRDSGFCNFFCFYNEIWGMLANLVFLEGPFLTVRLILMIGGFIKIQSTILFFTFKNFLTFLIVFNRIRVIMRDEYKPWKIQIRDMGNYNRMTA